LSKMFAVKSRLPQSLRSFAMTYRKSQILILIIARDVPLIITKCSVFSSINLKINF
jgi:hypothetical protein